MKVLTFSRHFPKGHPKAGQPTYFVEKIWNNFRGDDFSLPDHFIPWTDNYSLLLSSVDYLNAMAVREAKHHTIRVGARWKPGDMASLRVWSDKPYRSKQIEFAQVEIKKVWNIEIYQRETVWEFKLNGKALFWDDFNIDEFVDMLATNDGLTLPDFLNWFSIHPKAKERTFRGQIICWSDAVDYSLLTSKQNT